MIARDSRKIFRLFKSIHEVKSMKEKIEKDLIWQTNKTPVILDILSRLGFFFYWIFDNIQILASIKFLNTDPNFHLKLASYGWLFGIVTSIVRQVMDLISLLQKKNNKTDKENVDKMILKTLVELSGKFGDMLVAANGANIAQIFNGGKALNEGLLSFAGLWAGLVSLVNLYLK